MANEICNAFIALLRKEICGEAELDGTVREVVTSDTLPELYRMAKSHDVAHIVGNALASADLLTLPAAAEKFAKQQMMAGYRYVKINYELEQLCTALETAEIPFMPLKGSVIRPYYPSPEMRTSCDIDVYIKESDLDRAVAALRDTLGYREDQKYIYDYSMFSPAEIHVELHFNLLEDGKQFASVLNQVWETASLKKDTKYHYMMSAEMFTVYHIIHMAKHFLTGGCGVRPFADLWIIQNRMGYDVETVEKMLKECGLERFWHSVTALTDVWFSGRPHDAFTRDMQDYILDSGIYGTLKSKMSITQAQSGGKIKYTLSRIFMPFVLLKTHYPKLEKYPILYPFYQVKRWFRILFTNKEHAVREVQMTGEITKEERKKMTELRRHIGL